MGGLRAGRDRPGVDAWQQTGVFIGVMYHDYATRMLPGCPAELEGYFSTSSMGSVPRAGWPTPSVWKGPPSALTRRARRRWWRCTWRCQALRRGECSLALAGGVTLMSTPGIFVVFSRQRALSAGRSV